MRWGVGALVAFLVTLLCQNLYFTRDGWLWGDVQGVPSIAGGVGALGERAINKTVATLLYAGDVVLDKGLKGLQGLVGQVTDVMNNLGLGGLLGKGMGFLDEKLGEARGWFAKTKFGGLLLILFVSTLILNRVRG